jgi:hypothetical protein
MAADLKPAMIAVGRHMFCAYVLVGIREKRFHGGVHGGTVSFQRKQPIPAFFSVSGVYAPRL